MAAGAPFLIKLTATSGDDLALGATVLMVLIVSTVVVLPVGLPVVLESVTLDAGAIRAARSDDRAPDPRHGPGRGRRSGSCRSSSPGSLG